MACAAGVSETEFCENKPEHAVCAKNVDAGEPVIITPVLPVGPGGCSLVKPACAKVQEADGPMVQWDPECQDGKWVCPDAPPKPEVSPCEPEPPKHPSGCPLEKQMCMSEQDLPDGSGKAWVEFEPTCHEAVLEDGKKEMRWLCEEPQSETPGTPKACCRGMTVKCLSCASGLSEEEYCEEHPETPGCEGEPEEAPKACCRGMTAECLSCAAGQSVDEYCEENPDAAGCEWGEEDDEDVMEYVMVKKNQFCGERGKRLTKDAEDVMACASLAAGEGYDAFMFGTGHKRGRCIGVTLDVTEAMWGQFSNAKFSPPCASGWQDVKKLKFFVFEPSSEA